MTKIDYIEAAMKRLERGYQNMGMAFSSPVVIKRGSYIQPRYPENSDFLFCYLKGVKLVSTINAAVVLLKHGFVQEIGALCRMIDDFNMEILFILSSNNKSPSKDEIKMLTDFFQEEFESPDNPLVSPQNRNSVNRAKINASFGRAVKDDLNPHDAQNIAYTIHKGFSGFVHGAYPHIMEMYGGNPTRFHMEGMLGTSRIDEFESSLIDFIYRSIMTAKLTALKLGQPVVGQSFHDLMMEFETTLDCKPDENPEKMIQREKNKLFAD